MVFFTDPSIIFISMKKTQNLCPEVLCILSNTCRITAIMQPSPDFVQEGGVGYNSIGYPELCKCESNSLPQLFRLKVYISDNKFTFLTYTPPLQLCMAYINLKISSMVKISVMFLFSCMSTTQDQFFCYVYWPIFFLTGC